jgi:hypothetical protein
MKRKHTIIYAVVCIICGILLIASSCTAAAGGVSAAAVDSTVTLTSAQTVALFGNSIPCEYLSTDGTYHMTVATYSSTWQVGYESFYSPDGQSFAGRDVVQYTIPYASDLNVNPADITLLFKTAVDISSLTYVDTAIVQYSNMDFNSQLYGTYIDYWYCSDGYHRPLRRGADGTPDANYYGAIGSSAAYKYTVLPVVYTSALNSSFSTGYAKCGSFKDTTYNSNYCIGIVCPILSSDWRYDGNTGAGGGSGDDSSGGGSVDMSGVESRLDTIISKLDAIIAEMNEDEDSSGETTIPPGGNPDEPFGTEPVDFDYDAAAAAAEPAYDMPFLAPSDTPTGGTGMAIQNGCGIAPPDSVAPVDVSSDSIAGGIGLLWYLLQSVLNVVPVYSRLIMANLAISLAVYFIFRGGNN